MGSYRFLSAVLVEKYGVQTQAVHPDATLVELGLDSLSLTELLFDLEDEFGIEIPEDQAEARFNTLGDAAALVDELVRAKTA